MNPKTAKSLTPLRTVSDSSNVSVVNQQKGTPQTYAEKAQKEKESKDTKLYYAIWRTAFTKAIEKLRDNNVNHWFTIELNVINTRPCIVCSGGSEVSQSKKISLICDML